MLKRGVFHPEGRGQIIENLTALISLLFLVVMVAMASALPLDSGSDSCAVTEANLSLMGEWVKKAYTLAAGGYGEAVAGTGKNIYIARCLYVTSVPTFWHYNPKTDAWSSLSISGVPTGAFRNGAALAWDSGDYIYALLGGRYSDTNRRLFYRYSILNNSWEQLADTPHAQGAGDAIAWSGYDGHIYAITGNKDRKSVFAHYNISNNSWNELPCNTNWTATDDGASLLWTGGEYLYALRGEWQEKVPNQDFARFHILTKRWEDLSSIPESEGVGDGASLLWIGNWLSEYSDYIFALGGGSCLEDPGYNFYRYSILQDEWKELESIPCPVGNYVGNRLGFADGHIYYWQGAPSTWDCGGNAFFMFELELLSPTFDTGPGTYPSIFGTHNGTITPNQTIAVHKLYTYPCKGTGGHSEYVKIWNLTWNVTATWNGYKSDWHNISFDNPISLMANETYNYTIKTGSYPQIIHEYSKNVTGGTITCTEFIDANGKNYHNWIPAVKFE